MTAPQPPRDGGDGHQETEFLPVAQPQSADLPVVPGYELLDVLGHGGMGVVYRARQRNLDRIVALKTVLVGHAARPTTLARFEKEARTSAQLRHPDIVAAYDFGRHDGRLFFAMEFVEGEDLDQMIARHGALDEATAWGLARQVASGLAHAAKAGVVHRDVKPANILLVAPPEGYSLPPGLPMVKITDFGLALLAGDAEAGDRLTVAGSTLGTPRYMAPEQLEGSDVDCRADIYALGATVYHMLSGEPPFNERTLQAIITRKLGGESPPVSDRVPNVSQAGVELVAAMMARDPALRVADYGVLLERIDHVIAGRMAGRPLPPGPDLATTVTDRPSHAVRRLPKRIQPVLGVGLIVVVCAVLAAICVPRFTGPASKLSYMPGQWSQYLFDGTSLRGWTIENGEWSQGRDDEGGHVLIGNGVAARPVHREPPLVDYRISLAAALRTAVAVELQFGFAPSPEGHDARYVLRLEPKQAIVGRRVADRGVFEALSPPVPLVASADADAVAVRHELRTERHGTHWRAFCDAVPIAVLPLLDGHERPEFRLVTEGGVAWFDSILVTEMAPPAVTRP